MAEGRTLHEDAAARKQLLIDSGVPPNSALWEVVLAGTAGDWRKWPLLQPVEEASALQQVLSYCDIWSPS